MLRSRFTQRFAVIATWFAATAVILAGYPRDPRLDHDEIYWLGSAYYFDLAFRKGDWSNPAWTWLPARENPPLVKYVLGAGLAAQRHQVMSIDALSYFYLFWMGWEKTPTARPTNNDGEQRAVVIDAAGPEFRERIMKNPRAPLTRADVEAGRKTVLLCAAGASALLLTLGVLANQWIAGLLAGVLLLLHPAMISASSHAMSDTIALMFALAAVLACFRWYQGRDASPRRPSDSSNANPGRLGETSLPAGLASSAITGISLGLACAAKMNALLLVVLAGVLASMIAIRQLKLNNRSGSTSAAAGAMVMLLSALLTFILTNPAIWHDFPGGLVAAITEQQRSAMLQSDLTHPKLASLTDKLSAVVSLAFFGWVPFTAIVAMVAWLVVKRWTDPAIQFSICWWLIAFGAVTLWIPFYWPRYIIPVLPPSVWLLGCLASEVGQWLIARFREQHCCLWSELRERLQKPE